jgi:hypothetical protein
MVIPSMFWQRETFSYVPVGGLSSEPSTGKKDTIHLVDRFGKVTPVSLGFRLQIAIVEEKSYSSSAVGTVFGSEGNGTLVYIRGNSSIRLVSLRVAPGDTVTMRLSNPSYSARNQSSRDEYTRFRGQRNIIRTSEGLLTAGIYSASLSIVSSIDGISTRVSSVGSSSASGIQATLSGLSDLFREGPAAFRVETDASVPALIAGSHVSSTENCDFFLSRLTMAARATRRSTSINTPFSSIFDSFDKFDYDDFVVPFLESSGVPLDPGAGVLSFALRQLGWGAYVAIPSVSSFAYQKFERDQLSPNGEWTFSEATIGEEPLDWRSPGLKDPPSWPPGQICQQENNPSKFLNFSGSKIFLVEKDDMLSALFSTGVGREIEVSTINSTVEDGACLLDPNIQKTKHQLAPLSGQLPPTEGSPERGVIAAAPSVVKRGNARPPVSP